jgi:hypothetical protein
VADNGSKPSGAAVLGITAGLGLLAAALFGGKSKPRTAGGVSGPQAPKLRKSGCNCGR